jgi:hypothetical protein
MYEANISSGIFRNKVSWANEQTSQRSESYDVAPEATSLGHRASVLSAGLTGGAAADCPVVKLSFSLVVRRSEMRVCEVHGLHRERVLVRDQTGFPLGSGA